MKLEFGLTQSAKAHSMAPAHSQRFLDIVNQAREQIRECTVQDVIDRRAAGDKPVLLDVREETEFAAAHIPDAQHLGKGVIERDIEQRFSDPATELVLYCGGGYRSALAALNLQRMGYSNVISMDGGFRGWRDAGQPVTIPTDS
jgi:rhodanese-related sulfurtransferase